MESKVSLTNFVEALFRHLCLSTAVAVMVLLVMASTQAMGATYPQTRIYMLGDIDDFHYDGAGSVDDVYVDPGFLASWVVPACAGYAHGIQDLDVLLDDHGTPFTFLFNLGLGEQVSGATLTLAMRAIASVTNDRIDLEPDRGAVSDTFFRYDFADLGWLPISSQGTTIRTIDLANVFGCYDHPATPDNLVPLLQDGKFNVMVHDDEAIDYATLTVQVTPEPATLSLLALGAAALMARRKKN